MQRADLPQACPPRRVLARVLCCRVLARVLCCRVLPAGSRWQVLGQAFSHAFSHACLRAHRLRCLLFSTLIFIAGYPTNTWAEPCFDDEKLVQHLPTAAQPRPVLLYVWSPRMVYSVHNMAVAERAAAAQGLAFVLLHDARVPAEELSSLPLQNSNNLAPNPSADTNTHTHSNPNANPNDDPATPPSAALIGPSQPLCALALLRRDALRHFPTAFVLTVRGIHPQPIVGAMPASAWNLSLAAHLLP